MNFNQIVVVDTETTSTDETKCSIVQLGAIIIEPRNLNIVPNSECNLFMRPDETTIDPKTLEWHARRLKMKENEVLDMWRSYPDPKVVWPEFIKYLQQYHTKQSRQTMHTAPIPAGANIIKFDLPILNRYHDACGNDRPMFHARDKIDLLYWFFLWFENLQEVEKYNMDYLRDYLGISKDNAHDALQDVKDSAELIIRFMKLTRSIKVANNFKGACRK